MYIDESIRLKPIQAYLSFISIISLYNNDLHLVEQVSKSAGTQWTRHTMKGNHCYVKNSVLPPSRRSNEIAPAQRDIYIYIYIKLSISETLEKTRQLAWHINQRLCTSDTSMVLIGIFSLAVFIKSLCLEVKWGHSDASVSLDASLMKVIIGSGDGLSGPSHCPGHYCYLELI